VLPRVKPRGRDETQTGKKYEGRPHDDPEACHPWCDTRVALSGRLATGRKHGRHAPAARQPHAPCPSLRQANERLSLSRHPLSSASLDFSPEECSDDRGTVWDKPALRGLSRGVGLLRFLLDTLETARRQTASTMRPSGPSQNTAYEWSRDWGEAGGGPGQATPGPAPSRRRSAPPPASADARRGAGGQADAAYRLPLPGREKKTGRSPACP
jgi:hypothetical protein